MNPQAQSRATTNERSSIRIGARGSTLSLRQVELVADLLRTAYPRLTIEVEIITTTGDRVLDAPLPLIGGKGLFTLEIEHALLDGRIDLAVHSLKDLPTTESIGLTIGAIPARAPAADVVVSRCGHALAALPAGARIGTSSLRRSSQLQRFRPDLEPVSIRGNVETRIRKAQDPAQGYDAIVLAAAGLDRLGLMESVAEVLPMEVMLPAPGQGALAVQCRDDADMRSFLAPIDHAETALAVTAERAFLEALGGGCSAPVAAYGWSEDGKLVLAGRILSLGGTQSIDVAISTACRNMKEAQEIGAGLAADAIKRGASSVLQVSA